MRKFTVFLAIVAVLSVLMGSTVFAAPTPAPRDFDKLAPGGQLSADAVTAQYAVLMDANTGKFLYEKNADTKAYPASTTKIMTCLLALEKGNLSDNVTIGDLPSLPSDATNISLVKGEVLTLEELLYGLMLRSGNDAANAIGVYLAGSVDAFVEMMNRKAAELGMTGTHYVNTNGLHADDHYTTARDMAILARAARQYPMFQKLVSTYKYTMRATNKHTDERVWTNTNRLISQDDSEIYAYEYATGIKTGYTDPAGSCLVSSAKKDNVDLISVVLHDGTTDKWVSSITMFEYGFAFFDTLDLGALLTQQPITIQVENAAEDDEGNGALSLLSVADKTSYLTDTKETTASLRSDPSQFRQELSLSDGLAAPIEKDQQVGTVTYYYQDQPVLSCNLLAARSVAAQPASIFSPKPTPTADSGTVQETTARIGIPWYIYVIVIVVLLLAFALIIRYVNYRRSRNYRQHVSRGTRRNTSRSSTAKRRNARR